MIVHETVAKDELTRRLVSHEYASQDALTIIEQYRAELASKRTEHARQMEELSNLAAYRVARLERLSPGQGLMPIDRVAEVVTIPQKDLAQFCKANSINKAELMECLSHRRKETQGANNTRWQAYPLLYAEVSEQGNREAREQWERETREQEQYLANLTKEGRMQYKPLAEPAYTAFNGAKNGRA